MRKSLISASVITVSKVSKRVREGEPVRELLSE